MNEWIDVKSSVPEDGAKIDLWVNIGASPRSMGWSDAFRVMDAYRRDGAWLHRTEGGVEREIYRDYVTHWMRPPNPPKGHPMNEPPELP